MKTNYPDIGIIYGKNSFDRYELAEMEHELNEVGLKLAYREKSPYIQASIDFFVPFIEILLSPEIVSAVGLGMLTNVMYDGIRRLLTKVYNKFHQRPIYKIQGNNIKEEACNIHFVVGDNRLVLPVDVDEEKFKYVVDEFMNVVVLTAPSKTTYTFYSIDGNKIYSKTEEEIIIEEYRKQQNRESQKL